MVNMRVLEKEIPEYFSCPFSLIKEVDTGDYLVSRSGKIIRFCCKKRIAKKPLWKTEVGLISVITDNIGTERAIIEKLKKCKECKYLLTK